MSDISGEAHVGFMGGVLGRAKKVLFPDIEAAADGDGSASYVGGDNIIFDGAASSSSSLPSKSNGVGKKKTKSRSRRARLATSNSSLANISSHTEESGADTAVSRAGKENNPKTSFSKRGGNSLKMDSLAAADSAEGPTKIEQKQTSFSMGSGVNIHRRKSRSSLQGKDCSLSSACSEQSSAISGTSATGKQLHHSTVGKSEKTESRQKSEKQMNITRQSLNTQDELNCSSVTSKLDETTYSMADIDNSFIVGDTNKQNNRNRRGRRNQNAVSSLVQSSSPETKSKRISGGAGLSSLMALPSSTQKTQKSTSLAQKKATKKKKNSRNAKVKGKMSDTTTNQSAAHAPVKQTDDSANVAALTDHVESLNIGDNDKLDCSTPLTIRHRPRSSGITSPPGFLHRLSNLSKSHLFPDRSPMPDSNPNLKKKFDSKKTPDKITAVLASVKPMMASPPAMTTKMSISPDQNNSVGEKERVPSRDAEAPEYIINTATSPRVLIASSSHHSSPNSPPSDGSNILSGAKSNLFSSDATEKQADKQSTLCEVKKARPGSAVTMEAATPRMFGKQVVDLKKEPAAPVRGSAVMDVEVAAPMPRVEIKSSSAAPPPRKKSTKAKSKKNEKATKTVETKKKVAVRPRATVTAAKEEDGQVADNVRRSSRQSKPTDRLTVTSWKKKNDSNVDRKVRFDNSLVSNDSTDELIDDGSEHDVDNEVESTSLDTKEAFDVAPAQKQSSTQAPAQKLTAVKADLGDSEWTDNDIHTLRNAQKRINPTSTLYWDEVANQVGTKSSSECQSKWQSMVATPKVRKAANKKKDANQSKIPPHLMKRGSEASSFTDDDDDEDDLFNSSPYRQEDLEDEDDGAMQFSNFGSSGFSPFIKPSTNPILQQEEEPSALKFRRKGYNTYIDNLRKDINRVEKKKQTVPRPNHLNDRTHNIQSDLSFGEGQMAGKLLPDGTVKIDMQEDSCDFDEDDIWGDESENDEESF